MQPVELARKLAKEMDEHKTISIHRVYVPDEYTVFLNPTDREQFAAYETQMRNELAEYLVEHARREGYSLPRRPLVLLETEPELVVGTFGIAVATAARAARRSGRRPHIRRRRRRCRRICPRGHRRCRRRPPVPAAAEPPEPAAPAAPPRRWSTRRPPEPERDRDGHAGVVRRHVRDRAAGDGDRRSSECDITLEDANVSRRHAEVRRIGDGYSLVDLGSTNGTEVNGQRIQETALMNGDVISVGTTRITFERRLG